MRHLAQLLFQQQLIGLSGRASFQQALGHRLAIDVELLVLVADMIARQADHALDEVHRGIFRKAEYHHIATLRLTEIDDLGIGHR